ncbi:hypothetical protein G7Y89_g6866 [Cudoniella acicularis]|uniref:DUF1746 domain-containing protein n=1 Tax=Cudoniella acicularis TaxID=354080 RepID=A0A8H4RLW3_9HELO|nr:hypothetical protein G7Y89_g6866 [Cudoniella acicularis]
MNNDSTPNPAEVLPTADTTNRADSIESGTRTQHALSPAKRKFQAQMVKKLDFIDGLMKNLDILVWVELCILYYMDCSLFRFFIRGLNQMMFLTPKPHFIPPMPKHRPYIGAIFGPFIICVLLHLFTARSEAGEAMRGYLHGGIIVDLIGQKGPTSKIHLLLLDCLVLGLQCFMLAVHVERERLKTVLTAYTSPGRTRNQPRAEVTSSQDHDAEERGIMRDAVTNTGDIELQPLASRNDGPSTGQEDTTERDEERARLLAEPPPTEHGDEAGLDMFWTGTVIVADFHIMHNLRRQWENYGSATAFQTVGFSAELTAATEADRTLRLNAVTQRFQQGVNALTS